MQRALCYPQKRKNKEKDSTKTENKIIYITILKIKEYNKEKNNLKNK